VRKSELLTILPLLKDPYVLFRKTNAKELYNAYHHHPEIQLEYIVKGSGVQIIGGVYSRFQSGDMVLLGSGLPHLRKPDHPSKKAGLDGDIEVITLIFSKDLFSDIMLSLSEFSNIQKLLDMAKQGILIKGNKKKGSRIY